MTQLAKKEVAYLSKIGDITDAFTILQENIGGETLSRFNFPRMKVPAGGGKHLIMPDGTPSTTVKGIIVMQHMSRAYWPGGGGEDAVASGPPQCSSEDSVTGVGDPGGDCSECPMARPGSSGKSRAQACKLVRNLYVLLPGEMLPAVLQCPPGSLQNARNYLFALGSKAIPFWTVETEIGAESTKNPSGQAYSKLTFAMARQLEGEELEKAIAYSSAFRETLGVAGPPGEGR